MATKKAAPLAKTPVKKAATPTVPVAKLPVKKAAILVKPVAKTPAKKAALPQKPVAKAPLKKASVPAKPVTKVPVKKAAIPAKPIASVLVKKAAVPVKTNVIAPVKKATIPAKPGAKVPIKKAAIPKQVAASVPVKKAAIPVKPVAKAAITKAPIKKEAAPAKPVAKAPVKKAASPRKPVAAVKTETPTNTTQPSKPSRPRSRRSKTPKKDRPKRPPAIVLTPKELAKHKAAIREALMKELDKKMPDPPPPIVHKRKVEDKNKRPVVIPKVTAKTSQAFIPDFTRSILDAPVVVESGPSLRYSDNELNEFKEIIARKIDAAKRELSYLHGLITRKDAIGNDTDDGHFMTMEDGSMSMEREQLSQMASRQVTYIDHLEKAAIRIENKTYGICRVTGKLIDKARLRAVPHATLSIEAKMKQR